MSSALGCLRVNPALDFKTVPATTRAYSDHPAPPRAPMAAATRLLWMVNRAHEHQSERERQRPLPGSSREGPRSRRAAAGTLPSSHWHQKPQMMPGRPWLCSSLCEKPMEEKEKPPANCCRGRAGGSPRCGSRSRCWSDTATAWRCFSRSE